MSLRSDKIPITAGTPSDVKSEQIRIIFSAIPSSLITILVISFILSLAQWEAIESSTIVVWFAFTNLLSLYRLYLYQQFRKLPDDGRIDDSWRRRAVSTSIASGLTWGLGGYFLFTEQSLVHQVFLVFVIAGICAGAITTLSAILSAACGFVVLAIVPVIIRFNLIDNDISLQMTIMAILFMVMILVSAQRLNQTIRESLKVRHKYQLAERTISRQAHFDELTELPNRRLFYRPGSIQVG
jgi:predicted signal transduction protein with EAL and GGDEF domain